MQLLWHFELKSQSDYGRRIEQISALFKQLGDLEFGFFYEKEIGYFTLLQEERDDFKHLDAMPLHTDAMGIEREYTLEQRHAMDAFSAHTRRYIELLDRILDRQRRLGLNHNEGLYGALRDHAHAFEAVAVQLHDEHLMAQVLMLRRHEKDFMLRGLDEYVEKYDALYQRLHDEMHLPPYDQTPALLEALEGYRSNWLEFVTLFREVGFGTSGGLTAQTKQLRGSFKTLLQRHQSAQAVHTQKLEADLSVVVLFNYFSFSLLVLVVIFLRKEVAHAQERNPLTGLNGNRRIEAHLKTLLHYRSPRLVIYFDFDNFKPFNDRFGFKVGDEAIAHFAQLLRDIFGKKGYFIGHVGGDDFIVMETQGDFDKSLKKVLKIQRLFEGFALGYYTSEEVAAGQVRIKDRYGVERDMSLLQVSAAMLQLHAQIRIHDAKEVAALINELKPLSKAYGFAALSVWNPDTPYIEYPVHADQLS
ncbi:MAG: GGDEF domain-containing protein [Campylobacterales bacterium]|nr:GGDEF domain-containing protein [Campylobacterales bacterium]